MPFVRFIVTVSEVTTNPRVRTRTVVTSRAHKVRRAVEAVVAQWCGVHVSRIRADPTTGDVVLLRDRRRDGVVVTEHVLVARARGHR